MANRWAEKGCKLLKDYPANKGLDWSERMMTAAKKINEVNPEYLYDFGCGDSNIVNFINKDIKYFGFDSIKHTDLTILVDLNIDRPNIEDPGLGLFLGLLEYIDDKKSFNLYIQKNFNHFIFSCLNKSFDSFEKLFINDYKIEVLKKDLVLPPQQSIYYCVKK
jgi:hypothetical protein